MKRVLFLDDDQQRIAHFRHMIAAVDCDLTVVETADECIAKLGSGPYDLVLLDHDLGGEIYCDSSREDCGMEVVRWLARNGGDHGDFIVHSFNEVAGATMYFQLDRMGYRVTQAPFGSAEFRRAVERHLGRTQAQPKQRRSLRERLREYFRSLRLGR